MSTRRAVAVATVVSGAVAGAGGLLARRYRRELSAARARLAAVDRTSVTVSFGNIEYAEHGSGTPLLLSHGIFQSCDSAPLYLDLLPPRRVIAPSRFGYLGSSLPAGATPADQADAFAELLDKLGIASLDVVGISAGTTSVIQFALRHRERVRRLVVLSGNLPGSPTARVSPAWARLLNRQLPVWAVKTVSPSTMAFLAGVPKGLALSSDDSRFVAAFIAGLFPITPRVQGVDFDAFVSNAQVNGYPLEDLRVPTLIVHAKDDPLACYEAAENAAERIPGARLLGLESGGHLLVGQTSAVRRELDSFLGESAPA